MRYTPEDVDLALVCMDELLALKWTGLSKEYRHHFTVLSATVRLLRERESTLQANVMAHKTWENEAVAQASNANLALNKIHTENAALRQRHEAACAVLDSCGTFTTDPEQPELVWVNLRVDRAAWEAWRGRQT